MSVITLYQMGIISHLPEPPLPYLDADKVDASAEAYARLATPDGALGLASYAGTVVLAAMGGPERMHSRPWMPLALAAKVLGFDTPFAAKLTVDQWTTHRAFCTYCLIASAATFASVPLAALELRDQLRRLAGRSGGPRDGVERGSGGTTGDRRNAGYVTSQAPGEVAR